MEFRILGPLEVRDGERILALGGNRRRAVLGLLLLDANRVVSVDRLVDGGSGATRHPPPRTRRSRTTSSARGTSSAIAAIRFVKLISAAASRRAVTALQQPANSPL